jgi:class 3 adenylate cyclase
VGLHSGPVMAGVIATRKFAYDVWGDTVNIAARLEVAMVPYSCGSYAG